MSQDLLKLNDTTDDQLVIIREFSAPITLVFDVLTKHEHIVKWNCPNNMIVTFSEGDLKVGSTYKYGMRSNSNQGPEIILFGKYKEIDRPNKIVFTQRAQMPDGNVGPDTTITIKLSEENNKTQMVFHHSGFMSKPGRDNARKGWEEALDKLTKLIYSIV